MAYRYLMFFQDGKVTVLNYEKREDKLLSITNKGEKTFCICEDFWEWWKSMASYIDGEPVDFCLLYDKDYEILHTEFNMTEGSDWTLDIVERFFEEMTKYGDITLIGKDNVKVKVNHGNKVFGDSEKIIYYTNLYLGRNQKSQRQEEDNESTVFARYCQGLLEESENG